MGKSVEVIGLGPKMLVSIISGIVILIASTVYATLKDTKTGTEISKMIQTESPFAAERQTFLQHGKDIAALEELHSSDFKELEHRLDGISETQAVHSSKLDRIIEALP